MWTISGNSRPFCDRISRRTFLKVGALLSGGLTLPNLLRCRAAAATDGAKARSAILVYLAGGPSHFETLDPKPDAPAEIRGPFKPIPTAVPGLQISETLPLLAKSADRFSIIRSCCHDNPGHGGGNRYVHTGYKSASLEFELPHDYPVLGSVVAKLRGPMSAGMPTFVRCPPSNDGGPAFLGHAYGPFDVYSNGKPQGMSVSPILPLTRLEDRRTLRAAFDSAQRFGDQKQLADAMDDLERQAFEMISRPAARAAFDLSREPLKLRERYGNHDAGRCCLLARRFVEAGAGVVSVRIGSWDHHGNAGGTVTSGAKENCPPLDQALSALINDLHDRGLSDQVLVWCWGEFGRTPRINQFAGRDHWPQAMSVLMAGGGLKVGHVIGATDRKGERPAERTLSPADVLATVYHRLGVDTQHTFMASGNRPIEVLNHGASIDELL
jgi:uncharacterized protein (DUF1501 family)